MTTVGFIGAGKVTQALMKGLLSSGAVTPSRIFASSKTDASLQKLKVFGVNTCLDNLWTVKNSNITILALKPNVFAKVLTEIAPAVGPNNIIVSVAAGVTIDSIQKRLPHHAKVVRAMLNTAVQIRDGAICYSGGRNIVESDTELIQRFFSSVGLTLESEEKHLDAVVGLSGSAPAYFYLILEALSDAGVRHGLSRDVATRHASQAMLGAARMVKESGRHPGELKDEVCSPGGVTINAIYSLEKAGVRAAMMDAVDACIARNYELAKLIDMDNVK